MDDIHDEEFPRATFLPPLAARREVGHGREAEAPQEEGGPRRIAGREEQLIGPPGRPRALRVQPLGPQAARAVGEELQLLAALEVAGAGAAPAVLEIEDEGYVRETAASERPSAGRRRSEGGAPATQERLAMARARDQLEVLLTELHSRGWVLGAPSGEGLGMRSDGSVMVVDLHGLRRADGLSAQQKDRHWVDSVLHDQDRTLRRRLHSPELSGAPGAFALGNATEEVPERDTHVAEHPATPEHRSAAEPPAPGVPVEPGLPVPRRLRRRRTEVMPGSTAADPAISGAAARSVMRAVREVLAQPRLRRTAVTSALAVLLCGTLFALGIGWAGEREPGSTAAPPPVQTTPPEPAQAAEPAPAPEIEDPWALAADLAGARHSYVTGVSDRPASVPGSQALAQDDEIRAAYEGITVHGGGPIVHEAEVVDGATPEGTAVLRIVTSTQEHEVESAQGTTTSMPATEQAAVLLTLHWDGAQWRILQVEQDESDEPARE
ncbi:hypothetical protein [Brachybacterium sp.]|uniref:hypothetical protein n=1 Tax=Brachybacterium sp. TaxID=1891286 RepID=UPI002ED480A6